MSAGSTWLCGLLAHRRGRLVGVAAGIALSVALLVSLGTFLAGSKATMTQRSAATVSVDWQVQVASGADPAAVATTVEARAGTRVADVVRFAATDAFGATSGSGQQATQQTTGPGVVVGLPPAYGRDFPTASRVLAGRDSGVRLIQQTAANLRAEVGDTITVTVAGASVDLVVDGVVDLPQADSFFQSVGAPPQSQPVAPPDNVALVPDGTFASSVAPLAASRPDLLSAQVHAARSHALPPDPAAAFAQEGGAARNTEVTLAGTGTVGDDLGATLDAARQDALYAQVLFLFLGVPGAAIAGALTAAVAGRAPRAAARSRPCCAPAAPPRARCYAWPRSRPQRRRSSAPCSGSPARP